MRGRIWIKELLSEHDNITEVNNNDQLIPLLLNDRVSAFLVDNYWWAKQQSKYPQLHYHSVYDGSLYIWLLKKHHSLTTDIKQALQNYVEKYGDFRGDPPKP